MDKIIVKSIGSLLIMRRFFFSDRCNDRIYSKIILDSYAKQNKKPMDFDNEFVEAILNKDRIVNSSLIISCFFIYRETLVVEQSTNGGIQK